ncbi:MAG: DUF3570 domain-containing protein [Granulosicoccus sp.]
MAVVFAVEVAVATDMAIIRHKLAVAAVVLVSAGHSNAENGWDTDVSVLSYSESQERVNVSKGIWDLTRTTDDAQTTVQLVYDTMSGASPTGAIQGSAGSVTFTGASGGSATAAGEADRVATVFSDTRTQIGVDQDWQLTRQHQFSFGAVISTESDYESMGGSIGLKRESLSKNTAIDIGFATTFDTVSRSYAIGTPAPLSNTENNRSFSDGERSTTDLALGVTQVLNRQTLAQLTVTFSQSEGYLTDPYKVISVANDQNRVFETYYESRPESRQRTSAYAKLVHQIKNTRHAVHLGYRLYQDDWGIQSNTLDVKYRHQLTPRHYLEPHFRFYTQTAADFYQRKLDVDEVQRVILPADGFASADYRLDAMNSMTIGAKYGYSLTPGTKIRFRLAYLQQRYKTAVFDENNAVIIQTSLNYRF